MQSDRAETSLRKTETCAQRYRTRSRELREAARSATSQIERQNMEWVAGRYELMAISAELLERAQQPAFQLKLRGIGGASAE